MKKLLTALLLCACVAAAQTKPVTLRAGTLLDGKGGVQHNVRITVQDGKIQSVAPDKGGAADYDLDRAHEVIEVNTFGPWRLIEAFLPLAA